MRVITILKDKQEKKGLEFRPEIPWFNHNAEPLFPSTVLWTGLKGKQELLTVKVKSHPLTEANGLAGDYCIEGFEKYAGVERKGSYDELSTNFFTQDSYRFRKAWDRFVAVYRRKLMLLDFRPGSSRGPHAESEERIHSHLFRLTGETPGVQLLWMSRGGAASSRYKAGELIVQWLWTSIQQGVNDGITV